MRIARFPIRIALAGAFALGAIPAARAAQGGARPGPEEARRARWEAMTEEERRALRARYEEFRRLPQEEQQSLRERTRSLEGLRRRIEGLLSAEGLRALAPRDRFESVRSALEAHLGERRELLRRHLPPEQLDRLKGLPSPERAREMHRLLGEAERGVQEEWLRRGEREFPPGELDRLRGLPPPERFLELMRLRKERAIEDFESKPELGARMPLEAWRRLKDLPPRQFFSELSIWRAGTGHRLPPLPPFLTPTAEERARLDALPPPERRREGERLLREKLRRHLLEALGLDAAEAARIVDLPREKALQELRRLDPGRFPGPPVPPPRPPR